MSGEQYPRQLHLLFMSSQPNSIRFQKALLLAAIIVYPLVNILQGIDFTDFGFSASQYKFIFSHPASLYTTFFFTYLTNIIGGLVHLAVGNWGLIGFKIMYVLEIYLMCYLVYKILSLFFEAKSVLIAILVSSVYINYYHDGTLNWINYNDLTALFYLTSGLFMFYGLERNKRTSLLLAGFFTGLNFFIRISNLAGISLAAVIIIVHLRNRQGSRRQLMDQLILFGSGMFIGIAIVLSVMVLLGHFPHYAASFRLMTDFKALTPSHNIKGNLFIYFYDVGQSLVTATYYIAIGLGILLLTKHIKLKNHFILALIGLILSYVLVQHDIRLLNKLKELYPVRWLFWQSGVVVLLLFYLLYKTYKDNNALFRITLISLLILLIIPMGSDRSLLNANYGMWLALPLIISVFLDNKVIKFDPFSLPDHAYFLFKVTILSIVAIYAINANLHQVYRDSSDRKKLVYTIDHDYFRGMYTTRERATSIAELMHAISLYTSPSDYVLGHEYFSMANYLTDCPPYMFNPNPMYLSLDVYKFLYDKARKEIHTLPVIVSAKGSFDKNWPRGRGLKHRDPVHDQLLNRQREIIESLKNEGRYQKVWQNDFFEIWKPAGTEIKHQHLGQCESI